MISCTIFVAAGVWDAAPLETELLIQADQLVGGSDAVLVIDDTAMPKKGKHSVGVAPQYASALGKTASTLGAGLNLPQGSAPSAPLNGDLWTTSTGMFVRINGVTSLLATTAGPNLPSVTTGDLLYGSAANVLSALSDVAMGNALISVGVGVAPAWSKITNATLVSAATTVNGVTCTLGPPARSRRQRP